MRTSILARGELVITINTGVMGSTTEFPVDYEAIAVALAANYTLDDLRNRQDRGLAIDVMGRGAAAITKQLVDGGRIKAVIGMGDGGGTFITLLAMQEVPFGIPKLCLTTLAAKDLSRQVGQKDITLMSSVVDIAGLNSIITPLIEQAGAAICAMANVKTASAGTAAAGRVAISMFGNTTACVAQCTALLQKQGYEVLAFHATGVGGKTMEAFIQEGYFDAVLDITTTELADDLCGGICSAGPERLQAAARMGIPAVVVPGCLDMVDFGQPDTVPVEYRNRILYSWAPDVTLMRTNEAENNELGIQLAQKVSQSTGPVTVVLPMNGISQIDAEGGVFYWPDADKALFTAIKNKISATVNLVESAAHINDNIFSDLLVDCLLTLMKQRKSVAETK